MLRSSKSFAALPVGNLHIENILAPYEIEKQRPQQGINVEWLMLEITESMKTLTIHDESH
jgi:hypothetical protein